MNISQDQKNALAVQYEPLVNKITKQFVEKVKVSWDVRRAGWWWGRT